MFANPYAIYYIFFLDVAKGVGCRYCGSKDYAKRVSISMEKKFMKVHFDKSMSIKYSNNVKKSSNYRFPFNIASQCIYCILLVLQLWA